MKIISIGRGTESNIIIDNDLVSRRHATIKLLPFGKMEIRDLSKNGTYVNGIRLAPNKPYPVTRKDVVSFAQVAQLDWDEVPDPMRPYRIGGIAVLVIIVALIVVSLVKKIDFGGNSQPPMIEQYEESPKAAPSDKEKEKKDEADKEKAKKDSLNKADEKVKFFKSEEQKKKEAQKAKERKEKAKKEQTQKKEQPKKEEKKDPQTQQWL
ncbi:MAG: FHA domain-containing protein [Muribaculaceae bacterium]|nr:FHA domain-containing protein [Muribaculaceae bacterium]